MRVKISDVAHHASVGAGTVSRVLNGSKSVAPRTRQRVLAAIEELGYVPNLVARGLAASRTGIIGGIVPALGYTQHAEVVQGLAEFLHENGVTLMIGHSGYDLEEEEKIVSAFLARRPDALYLTGTRHSEGTRRILKSAGLPVVEGSNLGTDPIDCIVGYSNFEAGRSLVHLLHARGYRHIVHVTSSNESNDRIEGRLAGYESACRDLRMSRTQRIIGAPNTFEGGGEAVTQVLSDGRPIDALMCGTDVIAVGAIFECLRRGIRIPSQLAITGFDNLAIAASVVPTLTTVRIDRIGMGRKVGQVLLDRLAGRSLPSKIIDVGFEIVERGSTAAAPRQ